MTNTGTAPVNLSDISIKYWVYDTIGANVVSDIYYPGCVVTSPPNPTCVHPVTGVATLGTQFPPCGSDANHQANWEVTLTPTDSYALQPGQQWNNLQTVMHLANWANFTPGTSQWYSTCLTGSSYAADSHFGVYYKGNLVFSSGINAPSCRAPRGTQPLSGYVTPAAANASLVGPVPGATTIRLAVGLPPRDPTGLKNFIHEVSDPLSPTYRQYKTIDQITADYGPLQSDYQSLMNWVLANGLSKVTSYPNRLLLDISGTASAIEKALYVNLNYYLRSDGTQFYAPDREPSLDLGATVSGITRLNDIAQPKAMFSAGTNGYKGNDLRSAYIPCASTLGLDGNGQCIGIVSWDDTYADPDIHEYMTLFSGLPANYVSNYRVDRVTLPAFSLNGAPFGTIPWFLEVASDIEMALTMAPAATIVVYEGNDVSSIFNTMLKDQVHNCNQFSVSFGAIDIYWESYPRAEIQPIIDEAAANGKSIFQASGDGGAYIDPAGNAEAPNDNKEFANTTLVGGTVLTMNPDGTYKSEISWPWGGGGYLPGVPMPDYQQLIATPGNLASSTWRNIPDVAMVALGLQTVATYTGKISADCSDGNGPKQPLVVGGTSLGAPLWAGFMALVNQRAANAGLKPVGNLNETLYSIGKTPELYAQTFNDIGGTDGIHWYTRGGLICDPFSDWSDHGLKYPAGPGYDLATGWGSPKCALIQPLAFGNSPQWRRRVAFDFYIGVNDDDEPGNSDECKNFGYSVSGCDNYPGMPHYECNVDPLHPEDNLGIAFNSCVDNEVVGEVGIRCVLELAANGLPNVHAYLTFNVREGTDCSPPLVASVSRDYIIAPDSSIGDSGIEASHESDPSNGWPYDAIFASFSATNGLQP